MIEQKIVGTQAVFAFVVVPDGTLFLWGFSVNGDHDIALLDAENNMGNLLKNKYPQEMASLTVDQFKDDLLKKVEALKVAYVTNDFYKKVIPQKGGFAKFLAGTYIVMNDRKECWLDII